MKWRKKQVISASMFVAILLLFGFHAAVRAADDPIILIGVGEVQTETTQVTLQLKGPANSTEMQLSHRSDFASAEWEPYRTRKAWTLETGVGTKRVYARFRSASGVVSVKVSDTIQLVAGDAGSATFRINKGARTTASKSVELNFYKMEGVATMKISNSQSFKGVKSKSPVNKLNWVIEGAEGQNVVFVRFYDAAGSSRTVVKDIDYVEPVNLFKSGTAVYSGQGTVYYVGFDGQLHPFTHIQIFHSWFSDFSAVKNVTVEDLSAHSLGQPVCMRPGTWLVAFNNSSRVYAVMPGCRLRPIQSEVEAYILYGSQWRERIVRLSGTDKSHYTVMDINGKSPAGDDTDRDGLSNAVEAQYKTKTNSSDSDGDRLSDYEEVVYWKTDPLNRDTDRDGFLDGSEIIGGFNPVRAGRVLDEIPAYRIPAGTAHKTGKSVLYMSSDGRQYPTSVSELLGHKQHISFWKYYITSPPYGNVSNAKVKRVRFNYRVINFFYPTVYVGGELKKM